MIAYERRDDGSLVLAAGVPEAWVREAPGIRVRDLPTHFGLLDFNMCADSNDRIMAVLGSRATAPAASSSRHRSIARCAVLVDGGERPASDPRQVVVQKAATVVLLY
jgi:hypothetical protein